MPQNQFLKMAILLLFVSFLIYANSLFNQFVWDDHYFLGQNPYVKSFKYIKKIFSSELEMTMYHRQQVGTYRPVSFLSFMIDYKFWKHNPFGYHLVNVMLHCLNSILVFIFIYYLSRKTRLSLISALLFAMHPVHSEAVNAIHNRTALLLFLFMILSLIFYIKTNQRKNLVYLFFSLLLFILSLLSNEPAIIFFLIFIVYDYYFVTNYDVKGIFKRIFNYLPFCLVILIYLGLRERFVLAEKALGIWYNPILLSVPLHLQILTIFKIVTSYIKLLFFPLNLSILYTITVVKLNLSSIAYGGLVVGFIFLAYFLRHKNKLISFFITFFLVSILPFSLIIPFGARFHERFLYFPSLSFCFIIGYLFDKLFSFPKKTFFRTIDLKTLISIIFISILLFYAYQVILRNYDWRTDFSLWAKTVNQHLDSAVARANLGNAYLDIQSYDKALEEFNKSILLDPKAYRTYLGIGRLSLENKEYEKALHYFQIASDLDSNEFMVLNDMGIAYAGLGNFDKALTLFKESIKIWEDFPEPYYNIGILYYNKGDLEKAKNYLEIAVKLNPDKNQFIERLEAVNQELSN